MFGEWKEWKGYAYAGGMFITAVIQSLALHQYFHKMMTIGMRMRTGIIGLVYEKVIYLNSPYNLLWTTAENVDAYSYQLLMFLATFFKFVLQYFGN